jgi:hypothetical protein
MAIDINLIEGLTLNDLSDENYLKDQNFLQEDLKWQIGNRNKKLETLGNNDSKLLALMAFDRVGLSFYLNAYKPKYFAFKRMCMSEYLLSLDKRIVNYGIPQLI